MGIAGAAIATAVTQVMTGLVAPLLFKDTREAVKHLFDGIRLKFSKE